MTTRLRHSLFFSLLFATPLVAQTIHPTPENLNYPVTTTIRRNDTLSGDPATDALAGRLRALRVTARIGGEAGTPGADFGKIGEIALDRTGRLLILDIQDKSISRWADDGRALGRFGRSGGGPLEFNWPNGLGVLDDGTLVVGDRQFGLKRIRWDSTATYRDTWRSGVTYDSFCADGAGLVAYGWNAAGTVVDIIDGTGARLRGFGVTYRDPSGFTQRLLSQGQVGCLQGGRVASTSLLLPFVWIADRSGATIATVKLDGFLPMGVRDVGQGLTYSVPEGGYEAVRKIVPVGPDHFLVQLFYQTPASSRERAEYVEVRTYLISTSTARGLFLGTSLPVIGAAPLPLVYGWRNDPVPEVVILR